MRIAKPMLAAGAAAILLAGCATGPYYSDYSYGAGYGPSYGYGYDYPYYGPSAGVGFTYYDNDYRGRYYRDRDYRDNRDWRDRERVREARRVESQPNYMPGRTGGPDYTPRNHAGEPVDRSSGDARNDHGQNSPG